MKRQTQNSMLRYAHSCCVADLTITVHVALGMMIADGLFFWPLPQSSGGNFVRSVHALFHSDVSRYLSLQLKHIGFVLPTGSTNA